MVPEKRGASRPARARVVPAPASVAEKPKYQRRIPIPLRGVHPSWSKTASSDDSTCIERTRDRVLGYLAQPLLSAWTLIGIVHMLSVVGVGAWFFFMMVDDNTSFRNFRMTVDERHVFMNVSIQILTGLFTWSALLTMPWRLSNATHLTYNTGRDSCNTVAGRLCCAAGTPRSCAAGLDFYGKPTESIWFNIPTFHRRAIVTLLLVSTFAQFLAQAARIVFNSFEDSHSHPGEPWCNVPFFSSMFSGLLAAFYQLLQATAALTLTPTPTPTPTPTRSGGCASRSPSASLPARWRTLRASTAAGDAACGLSSHTTSTTTRGSGRGLRPAWPPKADWSP